MPGSDAPARTRQP